MWKKKHDFHFFHQNREILCGSGPKSTSIAYHYHPLRLRVIDTLVGDLETFFGQDPHQSSRFWWTKERKADVLGSCTREITGETTSYSWVCFSLPRNRSAQCEVTDSWEEQSYLPILLRTRVPLLSLALMSAPACAGPACSPCPVGGRGRTRGGHTPPLSWEGCRRCSSPCPPPRPPLRGRTDRLPSTGRPVAWVSGNAVKMRYHLKASPKKSP